MLSVMRNFTLCCLLGLLFGFSCPDDKETFTVDKNTVVRFDDPVFESKCLLDYDQNGDGVITAGEISHVTALSIDTKNIRSLGGIEYFTNLEQLVCTPGCLSG